MTGIGFLLQRAHNRLREQMVAALAGSGLHLGHVAILGCLAAEDRLTQRALVERTGIEKSSMVLFLDVLEHAGWVRRAPHPADRRAHRVLLTQVGRERLAEIGPKLAAVEERFLAPLDAAERAGLAAALARLDRE
jgi:DNA-binding MarR family transcriptional regulator